MNTELRLHGKINDKIEYFATAAGCRTAHHHFFQAADRNLRFFAPGSEIILSPTGVQQTGTGGTFCEYMFGVDQPVSDLSKEGIFNRLMLLGAGYNETGHLEINELNRSEQSYEDIFLKGHAIDNYFFFVNGLKEKTHRQIQEQILRHLGKTLKRIPNLNRQDDSKLAEQLLSQLPENCSVYLLRLSETNHRHFQQEFQTLYYRNRSISKNTHAVLQDLADNLGLDPYQRERICIDVMYQHRDNYQIIDDYKKVLVECYQQGDISRQQHARLTRLKALALRNEIPTSLLSALDKKLKAEVRSTIHEPEYTAIARDILHDLLLRQGISRRDTIQLLFAKQHARRNHDHSFEKLLLETGQLFDEQIRDGAPLSLLEDFSTIITFFDRYDSTATNISQVAFMESYRPTEELLQNLLDSRQKFNNLVKGLFDKLFFEDIILNHYLGRFGRQKLVCLRKGLEEVAAGVATIKRLTAELKVIDAREKLYNIVLSHAKDHIRIRYSRYHTNSEQDELYRELNDELLIRGIISKPLDPQMFQTVIHDIKKEAIYLRQLFPEIIANNNVELRNDFLANSGLDHFYIEELEREYFALNQLSEEHLHKLRAGVF
ncbi:TIGR04442 family protein [uncultured Desulfuromusa sp.]|uniref:TIGR04442 family protein n=1 Tax=uncultured Desulfuromusa sp. TaxID=219183 RepID=UPI002AA8AAF2|nr:TIGR04442 family protein [uncultured Desulfuromusa sp.]